MSSALRSSADVFASLSSASGVPGLLPILFPQTMRDIARLHGGNALRHRGMALMIDLFVLMSLEALMRRSLPVQPTETLMEALGGGLWLISYGVFSLAYFVVGEGYWGLTVGKWLMGLRVVDAEGKFPGPRRALIRALLRFVELNPLGLVMVLATKERQRFGDRLADTYVLRKVDLSDVCLCPVL
jgi:uncharacterized RDD family membrane protein YckC